MIASVKLLVLVVSLFTLSACVTQQYSGESESPMVQNNATSNEIAMTRITLGIGYLNMGNTKQAKFNLEKAKRYAPNLVQVYTAFAHYYDTVGETEQAVEAYEKALSINSDDADTLNNYGVFLCRQNKLEEAQTQFLRAIAVPSYILVSESYENLANCHLTSENFLQAQEYFNKAITHSPSRASSLLQMSKLQYAKGDYVQAQVFAKRYEKVTRRFNADSLSYAFKLYEKLRKIKTAKNYASMLLKMFPNSYEAKQYLLNGLVEIEADRLASVYRMKHLTKKKKRVVKLSPSGNNMPTISKKVVKPKQVEKAVALPEDNNVNLQVLPKDVPQNNQPVLTSTKKGQLTRPVEQKAKEQTSLAVANSIIPLDIVETVKEKQLTLANQPEVDSVKQDIQSTVISKDVLVRTKKIQEVDNLQAKDALIESAETLAVVEKPSQKVQQFLAKSSAEASKIITEKKSELNDQEKVITASSKKTLETIPKHLVVKSETLFSISKRYNIQMKALVKWNQLGESKRIRIGEEIFLADPEKVVSE